jgi:hypothetical protein
MTLGGITREHERVSATMVYRCSFAINTLPSIASKVYDLVTINNRLPRSPGFLRAECFVDSWSVLGSILTVGSGLRRCCV